MGWLSQIREQYPSSALSIQAPFSLNTLPWLPLVKDHLRPARDHPRPYCMCFAQRKTGLFKKSLFNTAKAGTSGRLASFVRIIVLGIALCLVFLPAATVSAQGSDEQRRAAIASAMGQAGGQGKVISVKPKKTSNGEPGFRIRILTDGRVRTFDIPANGSD